MQIDSNFSSKEQASFNFMAAVTMQWFWSPPKIKSLTVSTVAPSICHEVIAGRNINNLRYADDTTFMAESKEELNSLLKWKRRVKKLAWNSTFRKRRSWHPVPSLHGKQMGKQWKQWQPLLWGSKITADGDCSHEIKRRLFLERKVMTNPGSILKRRSTTLPTKVV